MLSTGILFYLVLHQFGGLCSILLLLWFLEKQANTSSKKTLNDLQLNCRIFHRKLL